MDKDVVTYPAEMLRGWKVQHEAWVAGGQLIPSLPRVEVVTAGGLLLPTLGPATVTGAECTIYRDHELVIEATSRHELRDLHMRFQFPECVTAGRITEKPAGSELRCSAETPEMMVIARGGGRVEYRGPTRPTNIFLLEASRVPPFRRVRLLLRTRDDVANRIPAPIAEHVGEQPLIYFAEGRFQYEHRGEVFERPFIVPLSRTAERRVTSSPAQEDVGDVRLWVNSFLG